MRPITINLLWVIGVLLLSIVALAVTTPDGGLLREYISFAAAVASILLAMAAIFYAFISNGSLTAALSELRSAASELTRETARLNDASSGLSGEAEQIIQKLSGLPKRVDEFQGEVVRKIDGLGLGKPSMNDAHNDPTPKSVGYSISLYLIARAYICKKSFSIEDIFSETEEDSPRWYCTGVVEAFKIHQINGIVVEGIEGNYYIADVGSFEAEALVEKARKFADANEENMFARLTTVVDQYFDGAECDDEVDSDVEDEPSSQQ